MREYKILDSKFDFYGKVKSDMAYPEQDPGVILRQKLGLNPSNCCAEHPNGNNEDWLIYNYAKTELLFILILVEDAPAPVTLKTAEIDGKKIAYSSETEFLVEVGRGSKGSYKIRNKVKGNLAQAVMLYKGINVGYGYKKRLRAPSMNKPILARQFSH